MPNHNDRRFRTQEPTANRWTATHVAGINPRALPEAPLIGAAHVEPVIPDVTLWDIWPIQLDDGRVAEIDGVTLWVMLSAPRRADPNSRHDEARMRLLMRVGDEWRDCGHLLPDGFSPGSREWSGSTRLDPATGQVTLWFTAAGRRGAVLPDFEQRLFQATGRLDRSGGEPRVVDWTKLSEFVRNDGSHYADLATHQGVPGRIKGFRDPYWFRDPATGQGYILFTGSKAAAMPGSDNDGVIGIAVADDAAGTGSFTLLPPLVDAGGLANELERPHVFVHDGLYYLFWSTQIHMFAPGGPVGPTGLYGMVAPSLFGPYQPLNGTGLVLANPVAEPRQAYAWQVLPSLDVISFVDYWGLGGRDIETDPLLKAAQFGGTIAPMVTIALNGSTTHIVGAKA